MFEAEDRLPRRWRPQPQPREAGAAAARVVREDPVEARAADGVRLPAEPRVADRTPLDEAPAPMLPVAAEVVAAAGVAAGVAVRLREASWRRGGSGKFLSAPAWTICPGSGPF
jgi:hypothetical protein